MWAETECCQFYVTNIFSDEPAPSGFSVRKLSFFVAGVLDGALRWFRGWPAGFDSIRFDALIESH